MKITITIPEGVYAKLERDRGSVPRSTYIQDLVMGSNSKGGVILQSGTMPEIKKEEVKVVEDYSELIERVGESMGRDVSYDERQELNSEVKSAGLVFNTYLKRLEKFEDGKVKIIYQY